MWTLKKNSVDLANVNSYLEIRLTKAFIRFLWSVFLYIMLTNKTRILWLDFWNSCVHGFVWNCMFVRYFTSCLISAVFAFMLILHFMMSEMLITAITFYYSLICVLVFTFQINRKPLGARNYLETGIWDDKSSVYWPLLLMTRSGIIKLYISFIR